MPEEKTFSLSIKKDQANLGLKLNIPDELEELFSEMSDEVEQSTTWDNEDGRGAEFYVVNDRYQKIEDAITKRTFNDYGQGLFRENKINLAPLRTKGASDGIKIYSSTFSGIGAIEFEDYAKKLAQATKKIIQKFVQEKEVQAKITIKI